MWKDSKQNYGIISKSLHWLSAITIIGLFAAGYWMVDLTYYSQWYKTAPHWHKSVGILLLLATVFRLAWRILTTSPDPIANHSKSVKTLSAIVHWLLYALMLTIMITGYLISTADERAIDVFNWFSVPSFGELFANQADIAGAIHEYGAYSILAIATLHAIAAIKHHVVDKDNTLMRMIK